MADLRFEQRMSDSDALMWTIEKDPMLRSTITAVVLLDVPPDHGRLMHLLERGTRVVPRMRQRVQGNPLSIAPPRWEVDPHFDLAYHVRWLRAGGERDLRAVLDLAQPIAMQGFDRARPLWEMVVVEGLQDDRAALIMKIHHAITDGVGAVKIALVMFELERAAARQEMPAAPEVHVMTRLERFLDAFDHERRRNMGIAKRLLPTAAAAAGAVRNDPAGSLRRLADTVGSIGRMATPATAPLSPLMAGRSLSVRFDTLTVPMPEAKRAAKAAGGRLNDAFVAATAAAFRQYHEELGAPVDALRTSMPINVRTSDTDDLAGNQFAPARFTIPLDVTDPITAMQTMRRLVAEQRAEPALGLVEPMARVLNRLPTTVTTGIFGAMLKGIDLITSNVPGAPFSIYTAGSRIEAMFALGPMAGAAANVTLLSYCDDLLIGVNTDPSAVTEPERLMRCYREAWDDVLKVGASRAAAGGKARQACPSRARAPSARPARRGASTVGPCTAQTWW
ncbi:MAG: Wax ester synthase-like Acyl-CoA acyltransferase domain [Acidimicrobiales bacterium]|nr:Wax ester synthase-like Acyl-CoA acyltransferase domain [Acidimicrobiales bacterium]